MSTAEKYLTEQGWTKFSKGFWEAPVSFGLYTEKLAVMFALEDEERRKAAK